MEMLQRRQAEADEWEREWMKDLEEAERKQEDGDESEDVEMDEESGDDLVSEF